MTEIELTKLEAAAARLVTSITGDEAEAVVGLSRWMIEQAGEFMKLAEALPKTETRLAATRRVVSPPDKAEDPYNAIVRWVEVLADPNEVTSKLLAGKRVALKDVIAVAGLPLTAASGHLIDFVPEHDSIVAERILRAGGRVVAFTNMEGMAFGSGGESGIYGATHNPVDPSRSTSGSSGGSAAALYYDGIDIAFGTDQGGSIRTPAGWCGVIGLKPSHGLVPYTGILSHDPTIDHVGPMARTVREVALALEAVAGWTAGDPRQAAIAEEEIGGYVEAVDNAPDRLEGLRLGVLAEAQLNDGNPERQAVLESFAVFRDRLVALGAEVVDVSIPSHAVAGPIMFAIMLEGIAATVMGHGQAYHWSGSHSPATRRAFGEGMLARGAELPPAYKAAAIAGEYLRVEELGTVYSTAQNVATTLRGQYDTALESVDAVVMPTTPGIPMLLSPQASLFDQQLRSFTMASTLGSDTPAHNLTGHPALSIPVGQAMGLPCGAMLVGARLSEAVLLSTARTWEKRFGWFPEVPGTR
ncbi:MAG: amidase family protein [Micrococcales bacterium]|nr:amidase family protein [Micrococcales bacterium]